MMTYKMALCEGRHEIPEAVNGAIFTIPINPTDCKGIERIADDVLWIKAHNELHLYVTGLSVALAAVIKVCFRYDIKLTLYHYDRDTNSYFPQEM